jgi:hypothetical protein
MKSIATFKPVGRLGNFLFEAASALAYAAENGLDWSVPQATNDAQWNPIYLRHLIHPRLTDPARAAIVREKTFAWHKREFRPDWAEGHLVVLEGYWQTERYFKRLRDRLLKAFGYPWKPVGGLVSVHVRRGDYLTIKRNGMLKHPPVTAEWYRAQMAKFPGAGFVFFSDDINWCRTEFAADKNVQFGPDVVWGLNSSWKAEELDLIAGSWCEHQICSASTFSWWQAWLNRNPRKRVIMPEHWITPGWSDLDMRDVVPKEWERA